MLKSTKEYLEDRTNKLFLKEERLYYLKSLLASLEEKLEPIKKEIRDAEIEIQSIKRELDLNGLGESEIITLRLGDLIDELSKLSGIDKSEIKPSFETYIYTTGKKPVEKDVVLRESKKRKSRIMYLKIDGGKKSSDNYFVYDYLYTPMNFDEIQADGKTLFDHCEAVWNHIDDMEWKDIDTYLEVYYDLDDIICHLNLNNIMDLDESPNTFYPKNLFTKAILNCALKSEENTIKSKQKSL